MAFQMTVRYTKLWKMLIDRDIQRNEFRRAINLSSSTYQKLLQNQFVSMEVIARICAYLYCDVGDVMEMVPTANEISNLG